MTEAQIIALIQQGLPDAQVRAEGEDCNFRVTVVSTQFEGLSPVKRQQAVLSTLRAALASGELHAVSIEALTPEQWQSRLVSLT